MQVTQNADQSKIHVPNLTHEELTRLERKGAEYNQVALERIGKNVTPAAQLLFDALCKTYDTLSYNILLTLFSMPCEWEGKNIRIIDEVVVRPPYSVMDCECRNKVLLERVQKVVCKKTFYHLNAENEID